MSIWFAINEHSESELAEPNEDWLGYHSGGVVLAAATREEADIFLAEWIFTSRHYNRFKGEIRTPELLTNPNLPGSFDYLPTMILYADGEC